MPAKTSVIPLNEEWRQQCGQCNNHDHAGIDFIVEYAADAGKLCEYQKAITNLALDHAGDLVYIAPTRVNLDMTKERWPDIEFLATREHGVYEA